MTDRRDSGFAALDATAAADRAHQIAILAEPERLRILSTIATNPDTTHTVASIARELGVDENTVSAHVTALSGGDLLNSAPGGTAPSYSLSPEAWVRFGRLLRGKPPYIEPTPTENGALASEKLPEVIQKIAGRLAYRYSNHFSRETVTRYVAESYALLKSRATVTRHLPSLTSRFATDRLGALATAHGFDLRGTPEILFVCVQNAGRSQIAAGILRQLAGNRVNVRTAGSRPAGEIDERIVDLLDEIGVPVVAEFPKPLTDEVVQAADVVVTMGCGDACPVYPGRQYLDWPVADPLGLSPDRMRDVRDDIQRRIEALLRTLQIFPDAELSR